ncbi:hypothetical protein F8M41_005369 [Gigaspora margarita]|uniref:Uncharacterized protein n=1 Tax=Gigaspora margarita TaxID=4874 RepID=A0A8H4A6X3_GIGMA|nr:hypothetical protein F8M41_005369 [Gigaspora margarita]
MNLKKRYPITNDFSILLSELQKKCPGNLENIKFNKDGKAAEITRNFVNSNQMTLRNKTIQSFNKQVNISADPNISVMIRYNNSQHINNTKIDFSSSSMFTDLQLQRQQQMPLIFREINGEDPDKVWKNINLKLHSAFGYSEKLNTPDENEKKYCLQLILSLQNWAFANKYPVRTWLEKAINTFGKEELERLKNFESVGEPSNITVLSKKRINEEESKQIEKSKKSKVEKDGIMVLSKKQINEEKSKQIEKSKKSKVEKDVKKWQKIADALCALGAEITEPTNHLVVSENNSSIEFGDNLASITSGFKQ